jgi:hypothetical protein
MATEQEVMYAIMNGINFGGAKKKKEGDSDKVKTKARMKSYHTGTHKSGAAKHKAELQERRKRRIAAKKRK